MSAHHGEALRAADVGCRHAWGCIPTVVRSVLGGATLHSNQEPGLRNGGLVASSFPPQPYAGRTGFIAREQVGAKPRNSACRAGGSRPAPGELGDPLSREFPGGTYPEPGTAIFEQLPFAG
jgi:hypothetical protein